VHHQVASTARVTRKQFE